MSVKRLKNFLKNEELDPKNLTIKSDSGKTLDRIMMCFYYDTTDSDKLIVINRILLKKCGDTCYIKHKILNYCTLDKRHVT